MKLAKYTSLAFILVVLSACGDKAKELDSKPSLAIVSMAPAQISYEATLQEGINFAKQGYPSFIAEVSGMSGFETWGRWSDADAGGPVVRFTFVDKLPANFNLVIMANAFGPNVGQPIRVVAGAVEQSWVIQNASPPKIYTLQFNHVDGNTIEFIPPAPTSPQSLGQGNNDPRKLGIGFISLKIN